MASLCSLSVFGIILLVFSFIQFDMGICIIYGFVMLILGITIPLINAAGVAFEDEVNFGMARGMGSLGYAIASYSVGYLTASMGSVVIPVFITLINESASSAISGPSLCLHI